MPHVPSKITTGFNLAMFAYLAITGSWASWSNPTRPKGCRSPGLILTTGIDMTRYLVVLLVTAFILQEFWGRLIVVTSGRIRLITYGNPSRSSS